MQKHKALISVYDKKDIELFSQTLIHHGIEILATGGTLQHLLNKKIPVTDVAAYTHFPEMLDGRVKTLHPSLFGGILYKRKDKKHIDTVNKHDIIAIDYVVVNLYPFVSKQQENLTEEELIEFIDIGGPSLLRAAAKNYSDVTVITDVEDYKIVTEELSSFGISTLKTRKKLAAKVFSLTSAYDASVANFLNEEPFPIFYNRTYQLKEILRYGENPHQEAAVYADLIEPYNINHWEQIQGKQLSYNNYNDIQSAIAVVNDFIEPVCCAVKHKTPCAVAVGTNDTDSFERVYQADPVSIFGGIVAFNSKVTAKTAELLNQIFLEVIIAKDFEEEAIDIFKQKKNCRIIKIRDIAKEKKQTISIDGGLLVQTKDNLNSNNIKAVTENHPTELQIKEMIFAQKVAKHCTSNAIVLSKDFVSVGIGSGQTNRIRAVEQAIEQAINKKIDLSKCVLASDAFFPFDDIVHTCAKYKINAIIQPGGSINDKDSILACNQHHIAMLFTGIRHFKH